MTSIQELIQASAENLSVAFQRGKEQAMERVDLKVAQAYEKGKEDGRRERKQELEDKIHALEEKLSQAEKRADENFLIAKHLASNAEAKEKQKVIHEDEVVVPVPPRAESPVLLEEEENELHGDMDSVFEPNPTEEDEEFETTTDEEDPDYEPEESRKRRRLDCNLENYVMPFEVLYTKDRHGNLKRAFHKEGKLKVFTDGKADAEFISLNKFASHFAGHQVNAWTNVWVKRNSQVILLNDLPNKDGVLRRNTIF